MFVHNIDNGDEFEIIKIESYDSETNSISFYTDSFSNYAIATKKASEETNDTKTEEKAESTDNTESVNNKTKVVTPKTGDTILVTASIFIISILGVIITIKFNKK